MKYLKFSIHKLTEVIQTLTLKGTILKIILLPKKYDKFNITLKAIRSDNVNKLIFGHLNINSIRNKFEFLAMLVKGEIDILIYDRYFEILDIWFRKLKLMRVSQNGNFLK